MMSENRIERKRNRSPTHPGIILKHDYLEPLSVPVSKIAECLKVSRKTMSKIVNERGSITSDMALRLSKAFDTTPELWLDLQKEYDLWQAQHKFTGWEEIKPMEMSAVL